MHCPFTTLHLYLTSYELHYIILKELMIIKTPLSNQRICLQYQRQQHIITWWQSGNIFIIKFSQLKGKEEAKLKTKAKAIKSWKLQRVEN